MSEERRLRIFVDRAILLASVALFAVAAGLFTIGSARDIIIDFIADVSGLRPYYTGDYPNKFTLQYVLPDVNEFLENGQNPEYNTAVDMRSKSFSAHVPIKVRVDLSFWNGSIPAKYMRHEPMFVIFEGSHNEPPQLTGLGEGYYPGYIASNITQRGEIIRYSGSGLIQYEMGGEYSVYLSDAKPSIAHYDPTLLTKYPHVNIAAEDATFGLQNAEDARRSDSINLGLTIVIIAVSIIALRPVFIDLINERAIEFDRDPI